MGVEACEGYKLYIRLPVRIEDEFVIKDLHPNIIKVHLPRQKSRRWCIIDFENKDKLEESLSELKKVKINNKSIKINTYKKGSDKKEVTAKPLLKFLKKVTNLYKLEDGCYLRGNPFEQDGDYELDDEWELTADEEWVTPPNEIFVGGDRMNFVGAILTTTLSSDDDSDWHEESVHDEYDDVNDDDDDEDFILDEDSFLDEDEEDLMEEAVIVTAERDYYISDLDDEIDYVTYPAENPASPEEDKATTNPNNSQSTENADTD